MSVISRSFFEFLVGAHLVDSGCHAECQGDEDTRKLHRREVKIENQHINEGVIEHSGVGD